MDQEQLQEIEEIEEAKQKIGEAGERMRVATKSLEESIKKLKAAMYWRGFREAE